MKIIKLLILVTEQLVEYDYSCFLSKSSQFQVEVKGKDVSVRLYHCRLVANFYVYTNSFFLANNCPFLNQLELNKKKLKNLDNKTNHSIRIKRKIFFKTTFTPPLKMIPFLNLSTKNQ